MYVYFRFYTYMSKKCQNAATPPPILLLTSLWISFACFLFSASALVQDLIAVLSERGLMKTYFLHLLIDSRIEELDVSICRASANKDSVMNLIAIRCQVCEYLSQSSLDIIYGILFETSFDDVILPPHLPHDIHE